VSDTEVVGTSGNGRTETSGPSSPRRRRRYLYEPRPWRRADVNRALVLVVIGLAVGVWGWFGVSGEVRLREQEGWIVVASFGAAIAAIGGVYLVTVAMRSVRLGQRQLMFDLADVMGWTVTVTKRGRLRLHSERSRADEAVEETATVSTLVVGLVVGPGMTIVHRSECPIARNKAVEPISAADAAARNLGSCGVCGASAASGGSAA
jgi:hypothetical protein